MDQSATTCWVVDAGLIRYEAACELQRRLVEARKARTVPDLVLFCEHPHVITLGRNGKRENLLAGNRLLAQMNVEFHSTDRGGDITYHGPGQVVGYPILDLAEHRRDVRWYVEQLEETMIRTSADYDVRAKRVAGRHGIWVETLAGEQKLGAIGVHLSRWVTSHGFAYNISTDLRFFDLIVPCGISGRRATSLERLLGQAVDKTAVRCRLEAHFAGVFERNLVRVPLAELKREIGSAEANAQQSELTPMETEIMNGSRA